MIGALVCVVLLFGVYTKQQTIVHIDRSQEISITYFLLLGGYGDETQPDGPYGTWNAGDIAITYGQKTKQEKQHAELQAFYKRTRARGLGGKLKILCTEVSTNGRCWCYWISS